MGKGKAGAFALVEQYFERLALRVLTRGGRRAMVLAPADNALLIRDANLLPVFAVENSGEIGSLGALWLAALYRVANHAPGTMGMRDAITQSLASADAEPEMIETFQRSFDEAAALQAAR